MAHLESQCAGLHASAVEQDHEGKVGLERVGDLHLGGAHDRDGRPQRRAIVEACAVLGRGAGAEWVGSVARIQRRPLVGLVDVAQRDGHRPLALSALAAHALVLDVNEGCKQGRQKSQLPGSTPCHMTAVRTQPTRALTGLSGGHGQRLWQHRRCQAEEQQREHGCWWWRCY